MNENNNNHFRQENQQQQHQQQQHQQQAGLNSNLYPKIELGNKLEKSNQNFEKGIDSAWGQKLQSPIEDISSVNSNVVSESSVC